MKLPSAVLVHVVEMMMMLINNDVNGADLLSTYCVRDTNPEILYVILFLI